MKTTAKPMTKWLLSLVFALVVISLLLVPQVLKQEAHADYARQGLSEGDTTIHISTGGQLAQLIVRTQKDGATWKGKTFVLDNDINMRSVTTTTGLSATSSSKGQYTGSGTYTLPAYDNSDNGNKGRLDDTWGTLYTFEGVFDGQGHTITGLYMYKQSAGGTKWSGMLFDRLSGTVKNVRFADCTFDWDQPKDDGPSSLGLIGGVTSGGVVENVILESTVTYITHRTATNNQLQTIGGIAGWVDGGTLRNCVSFATIVSANGQGSRNYPFSGTAKIQIGGVAGAIESTSTVVNCLGYGTYYSNVTARGFMEVAESYANPAWHQVCPSKLGNDGDKTLRNNVAGVNGIAEWTYRQFYYDAAGLPSWYNFSGTYTLTTQAQLIEFFRMLEKGMRFWGETVKLGNTIYLNSGSNLNLYVANGKIAFPSAPSNTFRVVDTLASGSGVRCFEGTFDGQGYAIDGFYGTTSDATDVTGMFGAMVGDNSSVKPAIKNLVVQNSYIQRVNDSAGQMGGLVGTCRGSVTVQNCLLDLDLAYRGNNAYYIGSVCRSGGTGAPGSVTFSNVVNAGTTVAAASSSSIAVTTTYSGCRVGFLYHNASDVTGTATDCLNMGVCYVSSSMGASDGGGYSNYGNANSNITKTRMQGSWTKNPTTQGDHYKQTSNPGSWSTLEYFESYVPSGVYNLAGIGKNVAIGSYSNNYTEGSSFLITSATDFNTMVTKMSDVDGASRGNGRLFKVTADLEFYPAKDMYMHSTWASGASITIPDYPGSNFRRFTDFWGVLDGQGHVINGLYAKRIAYNDTLEGGLFMKLAGTVKNLGIVNSFICGDHTTNGSANYANSPGVKWGGLAGYEGPGTVLDNCYFAYDSLYVSNYGAHNGGYGYLFPTIGGATVIRNVTCAGRFVTCNTSLQNTVSLNGNNCPCGVIAGNGTSTNYGVQVVNFVFSGYRSTTQSGSTGTDYIERIVHWGNGGVSLSGIYYNDANTAPTANGSTYAYSPRFGEVLPKTSADYFNGVTTSYKLPLWAQVGSTSSNVRLLTHVSKAFAKTADEIGFRLTRSDTGQKATVKLYSVYKKLTANGNTYTATQLTGRGDYAYGLIITSFPTGVTLTIEPYIKIGSTYYYGTSTTYSR